MSNIADIIINSPNEYDYCKSDCGMEDEHLQCLHGLECCIKWLNEEGDDAKAKV